MFIYSNHMVHLKFQKPLFVENMRVFVGLPEQLADSNTQWIRQ